MYDKDEKQVIKFLVMQELEKLKEEKDDFRPNIPMLNAEVNYEEMLKTILDKIEG